MKKHLASIALLAISLACHAEIYEVVDEHGNKTYTNTPTQIKGDARPVQQEPTANDWKKDPVQESNDRYFQDRKDRQVLEERKQTETVARTEEEKQKRLQAVKQAEQELEDAKTLKADDYFINNKQGGGIRYTQEYRDRVKAAEEQLDKAKKAADALESGEMEENITEEENIDEEEYTDAEAAEENAGEDSTTTEESTEEETIEEETTEEDSTESDLIEE